MTWLVVALAVWAIASFPFALIGWVTRAVWWKLLTDERCLKFFKGLCKLFERFDAASTDAEKERFVRRVMAAAASQPEDSA